MMKLFAGCVALALLAPAPVLGQGMQLGSNLPVGRSLPTMPVPVTSINKPAISLPGPAMPIPGIPYPESHVAIEVLQAGSHFVVANLAHAQTIQAHFVTPGDAETVPAHAPKAKPATPVKTPEAPVNPIAPMQFPNPDPLTGPRPLSFKTQNMTAMLRAVPAEDAEQASAKAGATFDNTAKPSAQPVVVEDKDAKPADTKKDQKQRQKKLITLPEWDLEQELGLTPTGSNW